MVEVADVRLLRAVVASDAHVLRQFFPPVAKRTYDLRPRKHPFLLPPKDDRYFVSRILFKGCVRALWKRVAIPDTLENQYISSHGNCQYVRDNNNNKAKQAT